MYYKFDDEVHYYQTFIKSNIDILGNLVIIKEQFNINNKFFIDILAYDLNINKIIIIELKNKKKDNKLINQIITYYDLLKNANIEELVKKFFITNENIISKLDSNPIIYIIMPDFDDQLIQNLNYINIDDIKLIKLNAIQNKNNFEIIKEEYIPQNIKKEINILNNEIKNNYNLDYYVLNNNKRKLIKQIINYMKYRYNCNEFYFKDKISIYLRKKMILQILINNKLNLEILIKNEDEIRKNLLYNCEVIDYKVLNNNIKIQINKIPVSIISQILKGEK